MRAVCLMLLLAVSMSVAVAVAAAATPTPTEDEFNEYRQQLVGFFGPLHLIPILAPAGEQVGYIYDAANMTLLASTANCFPRLPPPTRSNTTFPELHFGPNLKANLELGVPALIDFNVDGKHLHAVNITFHDAYLLQVSQMSLQEAFAAQKCVKFKPVIEGSYVPGRSVNVPLVIGAVYYARREIELIADNDLNAHVAASKLGELMKKLSLRLSASADVNDAQTHIVRVNSTEPEAVAIRPAFIPTAYQSVVLGGGKAPAIEGVTWRGFDPELPTQRIAFSDLLSSVICTDIRCYTRQ